MPGRPGQSSAGRGSAGIGRTYSAGSRRTRAGAQAVGSNRRRFVAMRIILVVVLSLAGVRLVQVQAFEAEALSAKAEQQRMTPIDIPAQRGAIVDRNGAKLAFSVETRTLSVNLRLMRKTWNDVGKNDPASGQNFETRVAQIAKFIAAKLPDKTNERDLLERFHRPNSFTYLVDNIEPAIADEITERYSEISQEKRAVREYPGGRLAANVLGAANWRMDNPDVSKHNLHGLLGLESARDDELAGTPGRRLVDTAQGNNDVVIPGTERELQPATPGSKLQLNLDSDLQYDVQTKLRDYVAASHAKGGSAVVMDAKTGKVHALASDQSFDPNDLGTLKPDTNYNKAVTNPYEPGSVNKVVAATAAIESGVVKPDSVVQVPGTLRVADHTIHDDWSHGTEDFTATGVFAKSSNIGTLLISQQVGEDRYANMLERFGIGQPTGIELAGESAGSVPPRDQWSGTTFANLPIGQGLSMNLLQMTGMYQTIANDGVRVQPRVVRATVRPDGTRVPEPPPEKTRVVDPRTANTVKNMLRAVTQDGKGKNDGTAPVAALEGYQISGKTGTGQQINPATNAYSSSLNNITFAGIVPAGDPRFVVGIMLDAPDSTLPNGHSAAPLFHDVASYLTQRYEVPLSDKPTPVVPLVLN